MKRIVVCVLAMMLALSLCGFAMAEGETDSTAAIQAALRAHDGSAEKTLLTELLDALCGEDFSN